MRTFLLFAFVFGAKPMVAQLYVETVDGTVSFDLCTCIQGAIVDSTQTSSLAAGPNGDPYYLVLNEIYWFDISSGTQILLDTLPSDGSSVSMVYGPNNTIYIAGIGYGGAPGEVLFSYNTVTGILTNLGEMPPDFFLQGDLFFFNGLLYGLMSLPGLGESVVVQIPINNPAGASIVQNFPSLIGMVGAMTLVYNGVQTVFVTATEIPSGAYGVYQIDIGTGAYELLCPDFAGGDLGAPLNYPVAACCQNFAGNFQQLGLQTACAPLTITCTHLGDEILSPGSALSFVLVADSMAALPGGVIQISANPTFSFNPATMTLGQTYFVAALAAVGSAGNPNWPEGCRDLSFFASVRWLATPTVSFSVVNPAVCVGDCLLVDANFTGTPPFNLTYFIPFIGTQTQTFTSNSSTIQVCPPAGMAAGNAVLQAVSLSDANCLCE